tara:strand:+ start:952 stop:3294 length:2343 start_codon:yes stop_codon:yes gene_type:complete
MTDNKALRDALDLSLTDISYNSKYIFVTVFYKNTSFNQQNIAVTGNNKIPVLRLTLSSGVVTSIQYDTDLTELEWLNRFDNNAPLNFLQPKYEVKTSGIAGGRRSYTNGALFGRAKSQTLRYEYSSSDWNTGSVTIEFLNNSYTSGGGKWVAYKANNLALWYTDELSNTLNYVPTTWPFWLITDSSNPIVIDNFDFGTPPSDPSINLHETCIPSHNIKFSEIYNVINTTTHDGITPISLNNFRSMTIASSARRRGLPANQNYKFNYSEGRNKTVSNYHNLIVTNVGSPINSYLSLPHNMSVWPTDNDVNGDGTTVLNDASHAWLLIPDNNSYYENYDYMSGNNGGNDHVNTFSFMLIHNESKTLLDIDWRRSSNGTNDKFFIYQLESNSGDNYKSPGNPGIYSPPTGFTNTGDNSSANDISGTTSISGEYIALYYYKSNNTPSGDDKTYIKIRGGETGLVPYNFVDTTPIVLNRDISLNSVTKGKMYAPIKTIKFGSYSSNNQYLPPWDSSAADGVITFDAGPNNTWKIYLDHYDFPRQDPSTNPTTLYSQLALTSSSDDTTYANINISGLVSGYIIPGNDSFGISGPIDINNRYLKFTYDNNIDDSTSYTGDFSGWLFTLQRIDSSGSEYYGNYTGSLSYPSLSINKDFRTRCKNPSPILKITEANGIESSGNTITNSSANRINLHLDVSGSRPPRISNDVLYDLSLDDITASNDTLDISSTFSGMNGTSSFILASIERVGNAPQTITVDVSANTFRNQYGNWNDVSGNDFGKFTWNYS